MFLTTIADRKLINKNITTEQIIQEVQTCYQVNMDCVLHLLAKAKYGQGTNQSLTKTETEIICLACSIYSDLEKSFIREYRRRINRDELNAYMEILNNSNVNLNKRDSAATYRNKLRVEISRNTSQIVKNKLDIKLRIATTSVKVFDDRASWSRLRNSLINTILELDSDKLIAPPMIMKMLSYKYPLV